jgi:hypothetical protein
MAALAFAAAGCGGSRLVEGTDGGAGHGGAGGLPGAGGSSDAGSGGAGGAGCDRLQAAYTAAIDAAMTCTPGVPYQCQVLVDLTADRCPGHCGKQDYVNSDSPVKAAGTNWQRACLPPDTIIDCAPATCEPPVPRTCVPSSPGASTGTCTLVESAGVPDAGSESCDQLSADYAVALNAALYCTPGNPHPCQAVANTEAVCNGLCPYEQAVNDPISTGNAYRRWAAECNRPCSRFVCNGPSPAPGVCVAVAGGSPSGGVCVPGTRGSPGQAGGSDASTPDAGETCDQLAADYVLAASAALGCTPGAPGQCQARIDTIPNPCGNCGTMPANDGTAVSAAWQRWAAACASDTRCPAPGCTPPSGPPGICVPVSAGGTPTGICVNAQPDAGT